ncbi:MAG: hypothetical protein ACON35_04095 [Candidatus Marinamargulisbacteria bacterium]
MSMLGRIKKVLMLLVVVMRCNEFLNQENQISLYPVIQLDGATLALNIQF